ncbi:MAG: hypothetical protein H6685_10995 [Deltaproteobacteria bacterium]|nr:hypothetical protein [Deltaproteobacteria bacterium]
MAATMGAFPASAHAAGFGWAPTMVQYWPLTLLVLFAAYALRTVAGLIADFVRARRGQGPKDQPWWKLPLLRVLSLGAVGLAFFVLGKLPTNPWRVAPQAITLVWFALAFGLVLATRLVTKKPLAALIPLAVADTAMALALGLITRDYGYLPQIAYLAPAAVVLHLALIAYDDLLRSLGSGRPVAVILLLAAVLFGPIAEHVSFDRVDELERAGRVTRVSHDAGPARTVWVDPAKGYVFYVMESDPTKIHRLAPRTRDRKVFTDLNEDFVNMVDGPKPGTFVALSQSLQGRGALLIDVETFSPIANFGALDAGNGIMTGPPSFDAVFTRHHYIASVRYRDSAQIMYCQMPPQDELPRGDAGSSCEFHKLAYDTPGPLFLDRRGNRLYTADMGSVFDAGSSIYQLIATPISDLTVFKAKSPLTGLAASAQTVNLYGLYALEKTLLIFDARRMRPVLRSDLDIYGSTVTTDGNSDFVYTGSWFDGQVQILRMDDGRVTRPVYVGPGVTDLAVDAKRQLLYAATRHGVTELNLAMVPMPTQTPEIRDYQPDKAISPDVTDPFYQAPLPPGATPEPSVIKDVLDKAMQKNTEAAKPTP